jgi:localization factor PodJL
VPPHLEALVQSLSDKIEQIQGSRGDNFALGHLEDRIVNLVEKLDASESRLGHLEAVERGLSDLLVHIETNKQGSGLRADGSPAVDELKHDIARTQDALNDVHGTLALVVDRLAAIEHGMRGEAPAAQPGKLAVRAVSAAPEEPQKLPPAAPLQMLPQAAAPPPPPQPQPAPRRRGASSLPINPDLPPDQPLEPCSGPPPLHANASARIAASEAALGGAPSDAAAGGKSSFIAAARRAAQAALQHAPGGRAKPAAEPMPPPIEEFDDGNSPSLRAKLAKRVKSLFVAASIIAIVIGGAQIVGNILLHDGDGGDNTAKTAKTGKAQVEKSAAVADAPPDINPNDPPRETASAPPFAAPLAAPIAAPAVPAAKPAFNVDPAAKDNFSLLSPPGLNPPAPAGDVTGSIAARPQASQPAPSSENLPLGIGGPRLRNAAAAGDTGAAYEVAVRYAEGRGVPANAAEAVRWFERAASKGLVVAQFRYASMLEKGQGVKKDVGTARKLYLAAAAKGNAKAMHNLAVLYAEGIDGKPDYGTAVKWFRLAAQHGIADSQYNLGVLAARGLGTDKSFPDSYKWFALAAARGDTESAKKRDEIAGHLDPKALAAAQQAVKDFVSEQQPEDAVAIPRPQGGWDNASGASPEPAAAPTGAKPKAHPQPAPQAPLSLGSFTVGKR